MESCVNKTFCILADKFEEYRKIHIKTYSTYKMSKLLMHISVCPTRLGTWITGIVSSCLLQSSYDTVLNLSGDHQWSEQELAESLDGWAPQDSRNQGLGFRPSCGPWLRLASVMQGRHADREGYEAIQPSKRSSRGVFYSLPHWMCPSFWFILQSHRLRNPVLSSPRVDPSLLHTKS